MRVLLATEPTASQTELPFKKEAGKNFIHYKDKVIKNSKNHNSFGLTSLEEQQAHKMPQFGIMLDKCETETFRKPVKSSLLY